MRESYSRKHIGNSTWPAWPGHARGTNNCGIAPFYALNGSQQYICDLFSLVAIDSYSILFVDRTRIQGSSRRRWLGLSERPGSSDVWPTPKRENHCLQPWAWSGSCCTSSGLREVGLCPVLPVQKQQLQQTHHRQTRSTGQGLHTPRGQVEGAELLQSCQRLKEPPQACDIISGSQLYLQSSQTVFNLQCQGKHQWWMIRLFVLDH